MKNPHAVALGRLAKGHAKNYTRAERLRRQKLMQRINRRRKKAK